MKYRMLFVLIIFGFATLFIFQNVAVVEIQFLFWSTQMSRSLLMLLLLALGVIIGWLTHTYIQHRKD